MQKLLNEYIKSPPEFMRALSIVSSSHLKFFTLLKHWEEFGSFSKAGSKVSTAVSAAKV